VRRHCDISEPARQRAAETPVVRHPTTPLRWLKVFSQATTGSPLRRHDVGSRFPLKTELEPTAVAREGCLSPSSSPGSGLSWCCCRQASTSPRGTGALRQHQGGAGERPPFSTLRARPNEHPSVRCSREPGRLQLTMSGHRAGFRRQPATVGPLPFKSKEIVLMQSKHETVLMLGRALQAPEVMLDDAV